MSAVQSLLDWRKGKNLTPKMAARVLRLTPETYEAIERGDFDCGPAIAIDISRRTNWAVPAGDLPGAEILRLDAIDREQSTSGHPMAQRTQDDAVTPGSRAALGSEEGATPASSLQSSSFGADHQHGGVCVAPNGGEAPRDVSPPNPTWSSMLIRRGDEYLVVVERVSEGDDVFGLRFELDPRAAAEFGMSIVRAALLASRPGAVPV